MLPQHSFTIRPVIISDKENKSSLAPVKICLTIKGVRTYKTTGVRIKIDDWDIKKKQVRSQVPNADLLNKKIRQKMHDLEAELLQKELAGEQITIAKVRTVLSGATKSKSIAVFAQDLIYDLTGKFSEETLNNYRNEVRRLQSYSPQEIQFSDVDPAFLRKYESWLRNQNLSNNTIHKVFKILKKFFSVAIREGVTTEYPFAKYDNPKYKQTDRTFLYHEEVLQIEKILNKPLPEYLVVTTYYWLLGYYSGLRFSDWERFNPGFIEGDKLILRTKKNGELVSWRMHSRLKEIVEIVLCLPKIYSEPKTNLYLKAIARLAGINKTLTTHVARHSFAVRCSELKISAETTAELMGVTLKTVGIYYKVVNRTLDEEATKWDKQ